MKAPLLLLLPLASCGPYYVGSKPVDVADELLAARPVVVAEPAAVEPAPAPVVAEPVELIGWDGQPVVPEERPLHGLESGEDTRGNLLSMFMEAKDEVDQLRLEVAALSDLRLKQEALLQERADGLETKDQRIAQLEAQVADEQARRSDVEARLVTAQIRRLEAEKQLLLNILGEDPESAELASPSVAQAQP